MSEHAVRLKTMQASAKRGLLGLLSLIAIGVGLGLLWGLGAAILGCGLVMYIDVATDEIVERVTGIKRTAR